MTARLDAIGDALERAATADLRSKRVRRRRIIGGAFKSEIDGSLEGTVEPTVDASKHVNGGCRSESADGRKWTCYVGEEAVRQQIVGPDFLGEYAPSPGVG